MGKTVNTPCCVKGEGVTECITNEKSIPEAFIPKVPRNRNRHYDIEDCAEKLVMPETERKRLLVGMKSKQLLVLNII